MGSLSKLYVDSKKYKGKYNLKMGWENRNEMLTFADWNVDGEFVILKNKKR